MQHGLNKPLTSKQIDLLPKGFTPTSVGITGQEIKRAGRHRHATTSRAVTRGRDLQYVTKAIKDADGNITGYHGTKLIVHRPARNSYAASADFRPWGLKP